MVTVTNLTNDIKLIKVTNSVNFQVAFCSVGASIFDIMLPDKQGTVTSVVARPETVEEFLFSPQYFGKTLGRVAGRIARGLVEMPDAIYQLSRNDTGNCLHGGYFGLSFCNFAATFEYASGGVYVVFSLASPPCDQGFPGDLTLEVRYFVPDHRHLLEITYRASTATQTIFNPSNHIYFNLNTDPSQSILDHQLWIDASFVSQLNDDLTIQGFTEVSPIMDFRQPKLIGEDIANQSLQNHRAFGYDHTWKFDNLSVDKVRVILHTPSSGRILKIFTNLPAVNLYSGNYFEAKHFLANHLRQYRYQALALEPQLLPGDVSGWIITPEKPFTGRICYDFSLSQ